MNFLEEFKKFAMRGNVVDLAIGVVIGGAFGKIVTSLVSNIIMPPLGVVIGGINFKNLALTLKAADPTTNTPAVVLGYGEFIQTVVDFTIIALAIFMAIKVMNRLMNTEEEKPAPEAPKSPTQEELLAEIRDLLKKKK
jgi:large conductance mechanosensitive channel